MTLLRTALIWDIDLTYQARVPKSEPTDNAQPNGSRLSCGANAGERKRPALRYLEAGAQTYGSFESRPRQLQALVRRQHLAEPSAEPSGGTGCGPGNGDAGEPVFLGRSQV